MICPKCKADMEPIEFENVEVDRCKNCKGIWFDAGEFTDLLKDSIADLAKRRAEKRDS